MANRGLRLRLWGEFAPSESSRRLFAAMARCGHWSIQMGIESFSDNCLRLMKKRQTVVDNIEAIRMALEEDIGAIHFNLIAGFPGTTVAQVRETGVMIHKLAHLLSDSRVSLEVVPYCCYRKRGQEGPGSRRETHYLPKTLRRHFPTQLLRDEKAFDESPPWQEVQREIDSLESCEFIAFDAGNRVIIEDSRTEKQSHTISGLEADIFRLLLDHKYTRAQLSKILHRGTEQVSAALNRIQVAGFVMNSGATYAAIPTRG